MTRRGFLGAAAAMPAVAQARIVIPVHQVTDGRAKYAQKQMGGFLSTIWAEAARDFLRCGVELQSSRQDGEIRRSPGGRPIIVGLARGAINMVLTDYVPMPWDHGRGWTGVSTRYEGYDLCMIALRHAHGHQVPFLSVNTCVHELLHVLFEDISTPGLSGWRRGEREFRIDWYATRLWLFHDGAAIRPAAQRYVEGLGRERSVQCLRSLSGSAFIPAGR